MYIAEIVPVSCLDMIKDNYYHMCLAQLVLKNNEYACFYQRMSEEGKYVIMDNGAAEGEELSEDDLIKAYKMINPSEIILPDTLMDKGKTLERSIHFYESHRKEICDKYKIMVVPQGSDYSEWLRCASDFMDNIPVDTIGVPKWLGKKSDLRLRACEWLNRFNVGVHLLGCNENPTLINSCRVANKKVRGCDSAFAYICAKADFRNIDSRTFRPDDVAIDFLNDLPIDNLECLMGSFEKLAGVENNKED